MREPRLLVFSGNANRPLANDICKFLGVELGKADVGHFADGECNVSIFEPVRGSDVFLIQPTCKPVNDNLMELLVLIDACKRASAKRVTAVMPYFGYARQDRKAKSRDPITAKLVANLLTRAGADRILTMDLHADQIQGFFDIPLDHLLGINMFVAETRDLIAGHENEYVVVSPDIGFVKRSRNFAEKLGVSLAIVEKRRRFDVANVSEVLNVIGEVEGKHALMLDEMVDTAGTLCNAAQVIKDGGALDVQAFATHGLLSGSALDRLNGSVIDKLTLLDTIPAPDDKQKCGKLKYITAARHFAEAIKRIHDEASLSTLF